MERDNSVEEFLSMNKLVTFSNDKLYELNERGSVHNCYYTTKANDRSPCSNYFQANCVINRGYMTINSCANRTKRI